VAECRTLLSDVYLQDTATDEWKWCPNVGDKYIVCGVYKMLMQQEMHSYDSVSACIWHKNVPLKVSICSWGLLHNRCPTKNNLVIVIRDIISNDSRSYVSRCSFNELAYRLLFYCPIFSTLWQLVKEWLRVY